MSEATGTRAGKLDFTKKNPSGLPPTAPLYGPGPYQYRDNRRVIVVTEVEEDALREVAITATPIAASTGCRFCSGIEQLAKCSTTTTWSAGPLVNGRPRYG